MHTIYIYICILFLCICIWIFIPKWCIWMYTIVHQHTKILCFKHETTAYFLSWLPDEWHLRSPPTHRLRRRYDANWIASAAGCCWFYPLKSSLLLPIWRWVKTRQNPPLVNIKIAGELIFKNTHVRRLNCHVCWFQPLEFWFTLPKVPFYWFQPVKSLPWYAGHSAVSHPFSMAFSSETNEDRPVSLSEINTANSNGTLSLSQLSPFKLIHIWILSNIIIQYHYPILNIINIIWFTLLENCISSIIQLSLSQLSLSRLSPFILSLLHRNRGGTNDNKSHCHWWYKKKSKLIRILQPGVLYLSRAV